MTKRKQTKKNKQQRSTKYYTENYGQATSSNYKTEVSEVL